LTHPPEQGEGGSVWSRPSTSTSDSLGHPATAFRRILKSTCRK